MHKIILKKVPISIYPCTLQIYWEANKLSEVKSGTLSRVTILEKA